MVSAYCLDYNSWVCIPRHVEEDFKEMVDMGYDTVCLSFCESDMEYARRTFEILVTLAHKCGLKVHVVPSRLGGRFAGAPLIKDYDLDGIVWDEPKAPVLISNHPDTKKRFGENPTQSDMITGFCEFMDDLTGYCKELNPDLVQTLFCISTEPEEFTSRISKNKDITYFGYDGNLSRQRKFKEEIAWSKYRIETAWEKTLRECREAGKKTFALVETMHMPREEHAEFEKNLCNYLEHYHPDHLSIYYYAHNADDTEGLQEIIRRTMKKYIHR